MTDAATRRPYRTAIGFNDCPIGCFPWPELWLGKLANPHRLDGETCPEEVETIGDWDWLHCLRERYGQENVVRHTPPYLMAEDVYDVWAKGPCPSDWCAVPVVPNYEGRSELRRTITSFVCNRACFAVAESVGDRRAEV